MKEHAVHPVASPSSSRTAAATTRRVLRLVAVTLAVAGCAAAFGAPVASASGEDVVRDCVAMTLKPHYPAADYRDALENMPSDIDEYSDCRDQIIAAQQNDVARPAASAAKANASPIGGSPVLAGPSVGAPAASVSPEPAAPQPVATSPMANIQEFDAAGPNELAAYTAATSGLPEAERRPRAPLVPIVIAFAVIVATGARMLARWGGRSEPPAPIAS